jgi:hypothetical protein
LEDRSIIDYVLASGASSTSISIILHSDILMSSICFKNT